MLIDIVNLKDILLGIAATIGAISAIVVYVKRGLSAMFKNEFEKIDKNFDHLDKEIIELQKMTARNYLSLFLSEAERGENISEDELMSFYGNLKLYEDLGGDGYVHRWVESLENQGKLKRSESGKEQ